MTSQLQIGIVGGSIAGLSCAVLLTRAGHLVSVFERSASRLEERGGGIGIPFDVIDDLKARDIFDQDLVGVRASQRHWCVKDGNSALGREITVQPMHLDAEHWGLIYQQVRSRAEGVDIRTRSEVTRVGQAGDHATVVLGTGERLDFDLVIGADGYFSQAGADVFPDARRVYAGYPAWRGILSVEQVNALDFAPVLDAIQTVGTPNGHIWFYLMPGPDGSNKVGERRLNWLWYDAEAPDEVLGLTRDSTGRVQVHASAPGEMDAVQRTYLDEMADRYLPPWYRDLILATEKPFMQPLYDLEPETYVRGRVVLVGDAASIARPHTGAGVTKAIYDAISLSEALSKVGDVDEALSAYDADRSAVGREFVQLGRQLGVEQVTEAPDWSGFDKPGLDEWLNTMAISRVYAFADAIKAQGADRNSSSAISSSKKGRQ